MKTVAKTKLDKLIGALETRLSRLKAVQAALDDELIAGDIEELFSEHANGEQLEQQPHQTRGKIFRKVKAFFESHDNTPATLREIIASTKLNIHSLRQVLYKTAVDEFERQSKPGAQRETKFRLKDKKGSNLDKLNGKAQ
jgi:hypothetical protein